MSNVHEIQGEFDRAIPILEGGLAVARDRELTLLTAGVMGSLASAYAMAGRVNDGLAMLDEALEPLEPTRLRPSQSHVVIKLSHVCLVGGRLGQARVLATHAVSLTREFGLRGWEAYALRLLGEVWAYGAGPDVEKAEGHYRAALTLSQQLGLRPLEGRCHLGLGGMLYRQHSRDREAQEHLTIATTMCQQMNMRVGPAKAEGRSRELE